MTTTFQPVSEWFNFGSDPLNLYPFEARCLAATFPPQGIPELLEMGRGVIDFLLDPRKEKITPRQIKAGMVFLYFPERWLTPKQKQSLMSVLLDLHDTHPLKMVHVITAEPLIISDFTNDMVRVMTLDANKV